MAGVAVAADAAGERFEVEFQVADGSWQREPLSSCHGTRFEDALPACPAVPVRERSSELRRLVVLRHDGHSCRVRILARAGPPHAHGFRSRGAGGRVAAVLVPLAGTKTIMSGGMRRTSSPADMTGGPWSSMSVPMTGSRNGMSRSSRSPRRLVRPQAGITSGPGTWIRVMVANVRWLSRYRHRRCLVPEVAAVLLEAFDGSSPWTAEKNHNKRKRARPAPSPSPGQRRAGNNPGPALRGRSLPPRRGRSGRVLRKESNVDRGAIRPAGRPTSGTSS